MLRSEVITHLRDALKNGASPNTVRVTLRTEGWSEADIAEVFLGEGGSEETTKLQYRIPAAPRPVPVSTPANIPAPINMTQEVQPQAELPVETQQELAVEPPAPELQPITDPDIPPGKRKLRKTLKLMMLLLIAFLALGTAGGVFAYFYILQSEPEELVTRALANLVEADSAEFALDLEFKVEEATLAALPSEVIQRSIVMAISHLSSVIHRDKLAFLAQVTTPFDMAEFEPMPIYEDMSVPELTLSVAASGGYDMHDPQEPKTAIAVEGDLNLVGFGAFHAEAGARNVGNTLYIQLTEIPFIGLDTTPYINKWIRIDPEEAVALTEERIGVQQKVNLEGPFADGVMPDVLGVSSEQRTEMQRIFRSHSVFNIDETLPDEVISGVNTRHVRFSLDKEELWNYFVEVTNYIMEDARIEAGNTTRSISPSEREEIEQAYEDAFEYITSFTGEIWVGKLDMMPYKLAYDVVIEVPEFETNVVSTGSITYSKFNEGYDVQEPVGEMSLSGIVADSIADEEHGVEDQLSLMVHKQAELALEMYYDNNRVYPQSLKTLEHYGYAPKGAFTDTDGLYYVLGPTTRDHHLGISLWNSYGLLSSDSDFNSDDTWGTGFNGIDIGPCLIGDGKNHCYDVRGIEL